MKIFKQTLFTKLLLVLGLYFISFNSFSQTNVTLTATGELTITGSGTTDDVFTITDDGNNLSIHNTAGGYTFSGTGIMQTNLNTLLVPLSGITSSITVNGTAGNDSLTLNMQTALPTINVTTQNLTSLIQQGSLTSTAGNIVLAADEIATINGNVITTSGTIEINVSDTTNNEIIINGRLESVSGTIDVKGLQETQIVEFTTESKGLKGITVNSTAMITSETGDITISTSQRNSGDVVSKPTRCSILGATISSTGVGVNAAKITIEAKGVISTALAIKDATITSIDGDISLEGTNSGITFVFVNDGVLVLDNSTITATGSANINIQSKGGQMIQSPAVFINNSCLIQCNNGDMLISGNFDAQLGVDSQFIRNSSFDSNNDGGLIDNAPQGVLISGILYGDKNNDPMFPDTNTIISSTGLGMITITGKTPPVVRITGSPLPSSSNGTEQFISGVTIAEYTTIQSDIADININGISEKLNPQSNEVGVNLRGQALIQNNTGDINIKGQNNTNESDVSSVRGKKGIQLSEHLPQSAGVGYGGYIKSISGNINLESTNTSGSSAMEYISNNSLWRIKSETGTVKIDVNDYYIGFIGLSILSLNDQPNNISFEIDVASGISFPYQNCSASSYWYGEGSTVYDPIINHDIFTDFGRCLTSLGDYTITTKTPGRGISINASVSGTLSLDSAGFKDGATSINIGSASAGDITVGSSTFRDPLFLTGEDITISNLNATGNPVTLTSKNGHYITATNDSSIGIRASEVIINGAVSPAGEDVISNLKATSNVTFSSEDTFNADILATGNDQLLLQGTAPVLSLGNSILDINLETGFTPTLADTFTIVDISGTEPVVGTFNGLAEGGFLVIDDNTFMISYRSGDGNDVVLTKVDPCSSFSTIIYVDAGVSGGSGNGTSWANALTDLQPAIDQAINCVTITEIRVATGTYLPTENPNGSVTTATNRNNAFHLDKDIIIKGSYNPSTDTQDYNNPSILSGDFSGDDIINGSGATLSISNNTENAYHVFITTGLSNTTVIDGFTIQDGNANESGSISYSSESFTKSRGGGIFNLKSSPTITNGTFLGNFAQNHGGGMYNFNLSSPIINNVTFSNNITNIAGAGMCSISADLDEGVDLSTASSPTITNSQFSGNLASQRGGGIYNVSSLASIRNSSFSDNSSSKGGGIYSLNSSSITVENVLFTNNIANFGGGMNNEDSSPTVNNCVFYNNSASGSNGFGIRGGGVNNEKNSSPMITNTVFSNNSATNSASSFLSTGGAGVSNFNNSSPTLTNVTFFGNTTNGTSGGILNNRNCIPILHNTVLYNNGVDIDNNDGSAITGANNFAENFTQTGFTALASDPFANSADPDGSDNIFATTDDGLLPAVGSILINVGNNSVNSLLTDITGEVRIKNSTIDIGAYEFDSSFSNWTGTISSVWSNSDNWSNGIPTATSTSIIASGIANQPIIISANNSIKKLTINSGASLEIGATGALTASENITNNGMLTINSDASNNGSLILEGTYSGTSNITYERYVSDGWHLLSSPINNQNISEFKNLVATNANRFAIATYNNSLASNRYEYYTNNTGTNDIDAAGNFVKGQGYSVRKLTAGTFQFTGIPNTDDISISILDNSISIGNKWNLVGNPFTTSIALNVDADATNNFLTANASKLNPARVAIYQWNSASNSYDIINQATGSAKYAAPGQGFFVEAVDGGETLVFSEVLQKQISGNVFSKNNSIIPEITLTLREGTTSKTTQIKYFENTTEGLDIGYDAGVFSEDSSSLKIYTHLVANGKGIDFGLQCLPNNNYSSMVIPLGISSKENKTLTVSVQSLNLPSSVDVYLEDKQTNVFTNLNKEDYSFTTTENISGIGRFYIHTKSQVLRTDAVSSIEKINMYQTETNNLRIVGIQAGKVQMQIYNTLGKAIFNTSFIGNGLNDVALPVHISTTVYLIKLKTEKGLITKKLILQ